MMCIYFSSKFARDGFDDDIDDIDQVDFISRYQFDERLVREFGVGHVGEQRPKDETQVKYINNSKLMSNSSFDASTPQNYKYVQSTRDLTLPLQKHVHSAIYESPDEDENLSLRKYLGVSVGVVSLIAENLLSHPFVVRISIVLVKRIFVFSNIYCVCLFKVLRRQCQVHHNSSRHHLVPVTLVPVIINLHRHMGIATLWKGLGILIYLRAFEDENTCFSLTFS